MSIIDSWSKLKEAVRYLRDIDLDNKMTVLLEQLKLMGAVEVGKKVYSPETLIRSLNYASVPRSAYDSIREDYKLPSFKTLSRLTSKTSNFTKKISKLSHWSSFWKSCYNNSKMLAKSVLGVMVNCECRQSVWLHISLFP